MKKKTEDFILSDYCQLLSAKEPVPGGGSVCGVYGAIASSLALMVLAYTIGKERFEAWREELEGAKEFFEELRESFYHSSDADIESYGRFSAGGQEKDAAIFDMIETPLEAMTMSVDALELLASIKDKTNQYLINDFLLAEKTFFTVFEAAGHNLNYNLDSAKDEDFKANVAEEYETLMQRIGELKQGD